MGKHYQQKITKYFKIIDKHRKIYGYNHLTNEWHCIECGISMGENNPRQLCGKYYCSS